MDLKREIKFRVWRVKKKRMYFIDGTVNLKFWRGGFGIFIYSGTEEEFIDIFKEKLIIMQYIGLKSRNGKEIYEGDIVKLKNWSREYKCPKCEYKKEKDFIGKIVWNNRIVGDEYNYSVAGYYIEYNLKEISIDFNENCMDDLEIIGNKFENPELLKEAK